MVWFYSISTYHSTPRAQGSKAQLPHLDEADDEAQTGEVSECMQELSVDETEPIDHEEGTGSAKLYSI